MACSLVMLLLVLVVILSISVDLTSAARVPRVPPSLPRQFRADLSVISHLTDARRSYPPSVREMHLHYDYAQQRVRAQITSGYDAGKTFVRRYDLQKEYMVKSGPYAKCERAYLGDAMPIPAIPFDQEFVGMESVRGKSCEHWVHGHANIRVHVYAEEHSRVPMRLTEENFVNGEPTLMLTYDLLNVRVGPQDVSVFDLPNGYTHQNCSRNVGGFPYIHAFHHYLRF